MNQAPRGVAVQWLHLDHIGTHVGKDHATCRPHNHVTEFNYPDSMEGQVGSVILRRIHGRENMGHREKGQSLGVDV